MLGFIDVERLPVKEPRSGWHGETRVLGPGSAAVVPPNTRHSIRAVTNARAIVVDHPRRESIGGVEL